MKQALIVGISGFIGSIARYKLRGAILHQSVGWRFPLSTFTINLLGCFVIGMPAALTEHRDPLTSQANRWSLDAAVFAKRNGPPAVM